MVIFKYRAYVETLKGKFKVPKQPNYNVEEGSFTMFLGTERVTLCTENSRNPEKRSHISGKISGFFICLIKNKNFRGRCQCTHCTGPRINFLGGQEMPWRVSLALNESLDSVRIEPVVLNS